MNPRADAAFQMTTANPETSLEPYSDEPDPPAESKRSPAPPVSHPTRKEPDQGNRQVLSNELIVLEKKIARPVIKQH